MQNAMKCLAATLVAAWAASAGFAGTSSGPDVVAFYVANDIAYYGTVDGIGGYAISTTSCNYGDEEAAWYGGTNNTPLIGQNAYRLKDGRFEQIGMSWLKHSFCALSEPGCGDCQATDCSTLGIGCADTYGAGLNTNPSGPRSDVNAFTGQYPYPFNVSNTGPSTVRGNLQIRNTDVDPAVNTGATYYLEAYYVSTDDAPAGNHANNASWREVVFNDINSVSSVGGTEVEEQAIRKWATEDPSVEIDEAYVPDDGFFIVGAKVTDLGGGMWNYEYAVYNHNSHACAGSFSVPVPASAMVTNIGFHDVDYHSGEIYDGTDWTAERAGNALTWSTTPFAENENGNALRWSTLYNFRFDANVGPEASAVSIGTFRPGYAYSISVDTAAPPAEPVNPCDLPLGACPEDVDGNYLVGVDDLLVMLGNYGQCGDGTYRPQGDVNDDCCVTVDDLLQVISVWGADCTPTGACCWPDGACAEVAELACTSSDGAWNGDGTLCSTTNCPAPAACCFEDGSCTSLLPADCSSSGGIYQGEGITCNDVDCPIAGAGDEWQTALNASLGGNAFSTVDMTPSDPEPDESQCSGTYLDWFGSPDIWFRFVPDSNGLLLFTTCDPNSYDTSMAIYQGDGDNQIACNGDSSNGDGCQSYFSAIELDVTAGEAYYIRIGGWQGESGNGTLTIE